MYTFIAFATLNSIFNSILLAEGQNTVITRRGVVSAKTPIMGGLAAAPYKWVMG